MGSEHDLRKSRSGLQPHVWINPEHLPAMDPLLVHFYRQYMQQVQNPIYPPAGLLLHQDVQDQVYKHFFDGPLKGPPDYQRKVLKRVIASIESQIRNPDEDEVSSNLMEHIAYLSTIPSKAPSDAAMETQIITYTAPVDFEIRDPPRVLIEESPQLLAAGSNVGLRTWEAALHLAAYLHAFPELVEGKNVLELGAGTGFISVFCAGILNARKVLATDGLPHVVEALEKNILRNKANLFPQPQNEARGVLPEMPRAKVLEWGATRDELEDIFDEDTDRSSADYNLILGADITYSPDVVPTLASLLRVLLVDMFPGKRSTALISATVRNEATLKCFSDSCRRMCLNIEDVVFECLGVRWQKGFFHEQGFPIRIMKITAAV